MNHHKRACLAYIVGSLVRQETLSELFDCSQARTMQISGTVNPHEVDVTDQHRQCHLTGNGNGQQFELTDRSDGKQMRLLVSGKYFRGFDEATENYFSGTVTGEQVSLFDFDRPRWYEYRLKTEQEKEQ